MVSNSVTQIPKKQLVRGLIIIFILSFLAVLVLWALPRIFAEVQYPLAYEDLIVQEAIAHDLDPFLVAAVIHTESRFRPDATSPVGARGLMQIMPLTGEGIARRMGVVGFTTNDLYDPGTNIEYGTFHLQGLMGRYSGDLEPAIVAYNGGGGAGDNYLAGRTNLVPLESLNYVKKVLKAKAVYEDMYGVELGNVDPFARSQLEPTIAEQIISLIAVQVESRLAQ